MPVISDDVPLGECSSNLPVFNCVQGTKQGEPMKIQKQRIEYQHVAGVEFFVVWERGVQVGLFRTMEDAELFVMAKKSQAETEKRQASIEAMKKMYESDAGFVDLVCHPVETVEFVGHHFRSPSSVIKDEVREIRRKSLEILDTPKWMMGSLADANKIQDASDGSMIEIDDVKPDVVVGGES